MHRTMALALAGALAAGGALADGRRALEAHEHGHSSLSVAVEGSRVAMELEAPGADIVGFEHAAESEEQKAALALAKAALAQPMSLFVLPPAAGCRVANAMVEHVIEDREDGHAAFRAEYALDCQDPAELATITFAFFDRFPRAEEIEVTILTGRGQTVHEVTRARPRITLDRLM